MLASLEVAELEAVSDAIRGVDGELKNIIFASAGPKPENILRDAVNNIVEIVEHEESCLVYDRPLTESGLTWGELVTWSGERQGQKRDGLPNTDTARKLYARRRGRSPTIR